MEGARDVLAEIASSAPGAGERAYRLLIGFLLEQDAERALAVWFGPSLLVPAPGAPRRLARLLARDLARIDELLSKQVNAILHAYRFQRLEASWRGLLWLAEEASRLPESGTPPVKVRVLDLSWRELARDLDRSMEFDQSQFFKKVYDNEFGSAGGEPFGALLGDYEVSHRPLPDHGGGDVGALESIAHVAGAAFVPFVTGCHPAMLGLDDFAGLEFPLDLARTFEQAEYTRWRSFRASEDSRFLGLVLPRVLARLPYEDDGSSADGFRFREDVSAPGGEGHLWGTAVYAFGAVLVRAFASSGWLADIRGVPESGDGGGVVKGLPARHFATDAPGVARRPTTDVVITDTLEKDLADLGFIALCRCRGTDWSAFYANPSVQEPPQLDTAAASANAKLSSVLQYVFCVSRFAHYVKMMGRDKVGSRATAEDCQRQLQEWLLKYTTSNNDASAELKARYPLREASVQVREAPTKPGYYSCVVQLKPHFQLDQIVSAVKLVTELAPAKAG